MKADEYARKIAAVERWGNDHIAAIEYRMARPPGYSLDPAGYMAHAAKRRAWEAEIAEIEALVGYVSECLTADLFHESRRAPSTTAEADLLERFG